MIEAVNQVFGTFWGRLVDFFPGFFGGLLILIVGFFIAGLLKRLLITLFTFFKFERAFERANVMSPSEVKLWEEVLAEILRWTLVVLFLIPTLEVWGLSKATVVLNSFLFYLPNVIIAVIIAFVGIVSANLAADLVRQSVKSMGSKSANTLSLFSKGVIIFFTILIVLNQLGVAQQLIVILFTGIVSMLALAGGLAFGLGGKEIAQDILQHFQKKLK